MDESARVRVGVRPNAKARPATTCYAFENGSPNVLTGSAGNLAHSPQARKIVVEYWPLKDGRNGGHFLKATHGAGDVLYGAGGPNADKGSALSKGTSSNESSPLKMLILLRRFVRALRLSAR